MEVRRTGLNVDADDLDVRGNFLPGCLTDCTLKIPQYMSSTNYLTRRYWCMGSPNAYRSEFY